MTYGLYTPIRTRTPAPHPLRAANRARFEDSRLVTKVQINDYHDDYILGEGTRTGHGRERDCGQFRILESGV
jgi:hypothetical protein